VVLIMTPGSLTATGGVWKARLSGGRGRGASLDGWLRALVPDLEQGAKGWAWRRADGLSIERCDQFDLMAKGLGNGCGASWTLIMKHWRSIALVGCFWIGALGILAIYWTFAFHKEEFFVHKASAQLLKAFKESDSIVISAIEQTDEDSRGGSFHDMTNYDTWPQIR
jgi:hypothetical protein